LLMTAKQRTASLFPPIINGKKLVEKTDGMRDDDFKQD
jgi:hypothetical protein